MTLISRKAFRYFLISTAFLMPFVTAAAQEWSLGPIPVHNQFPLAVYRNGFAPDSPAVAPENSWLVRMSYLASNTYVKEDQYLIDGESHVLEPVIEYGLIKDASLSLRLPVIWSGGGRMDRAIEKWHKIWGLPRGHRDESPRNEFEIKGKNRDGTSFEFDDHGWDLGNLDASLKWLIEEGSGNIPALAFKLSATAPLSTSSDAAGGSDIIAGILLSKAIEPFYLYGGSSIVLFTDIEQSGISYARTHFEGFFDAEYDFHPDFALLAGTYLQQTPFKNIDENNNLVIYLDTGLTYAVTRSCALDILVRENPFGRLTTDITFVLGLELKLQ